MPASSPPASTELVPGAAACLERLAAGEDAEAWAGLLRDPGPRMHALAYRLLGDASLADDAVQEALLALRRHAGAFRPRAGHGDPADDQARRWILRVVANAARMVRRGELRVRRRNHAAAEGAPHTEPPRDHLAIERSESAEQVRRALDQLPERERAAVLLHVVADLGYEQVAAELRCPLGTAKTWVRRGLARLRGRLDRTRTGLAPALILEFLAPPLPPPLPITVTPGAAATTTAAHLLPAHLGFSAMTALAITLPCAILLTASTGLALHLRAADGPPAAPSPTAAAPAQPLVAGPAPSQADAKLLQALDRELTFDFEATSLADVTSFLSTSSGVPMSVAADAGARTVTMSCRKLRLRYILEWCATLTDTTVDYRDGVHFRPATSDNLTATLDRHLTLDLDQQPWTRTIDTLRLLGLPVIDAAPAEVAGHLITIHTAASGRQLLDTIATKVGLHWSEARGHVVLGSDVLGRTEPDAARSLVQGLGQAIHFEFQETDLPDVASFFEKITGLNIILDPGLMPSASPVTFKADHMPLKQALEWLAKLGSFEVALRDGCLVLAARPSASLPLAAPSGLDLQAPAAEPAPAPAPAPAPHHHEF